MWALTDQQLATLSGNHTLTTTCHVYSGDTYRGEIAISGGQVTADADRQTTRQATITVDRSVINQGLLDPLQDQVVLRLVVPGVVEIPLFTGRVAAHTVVTNHTATVQCVDHADDVVAALFEVPWSTTAGELARDVIRHIIQDVDPSFTVDVSAASGQAVPTLTFESVRGQALDELSAGINCVWQANRVGGFALVPNPFATDAMPPSTITLRDDVADLRKTLINVEDTRSREDIHNSVTLIVERTDGTAPIRVTARDNNPTSPTYWGTQASGSAFGKRNEVVSLQTPLTLAEATLLARRRLRQKVALARTFTVTDVLTPLLDPLDVVTLYHRDEVTQQVIQTVTVDLAPTVAGTFTSREWRPLTDIGEIT